MLRRSVPSPRARRALASTFAYVALLLAATALLGCGGPMWNVVVQTMPSPFVGQRRFGVLPTDFSHLMIGSKPEPVYLAEKDPGQRASFLEDKAAFNDKFLEMLRSKAMAGNVEVVPATSPADAPFMIRPTVNFIEPGFYAGVAAAPSHVTMNLKIVAQDGRVLDEIIVEHGTSPNSGVAIGGFAIPTNPSSGGRLRKDGEGLGALVAEYLLARVVGR